MTTVSAPSAPPAPDPDGVDELLTVLARAGVRLKLVDGDRLQVTAPTGHLTDDLRGRIGRHKPELVAWLSGPRSGDPAPVVVPDPEHVYEPFPLSDIQTSFLMGSQEGIEYHVRPHGYTEFELGDVDPQRFAVAWNRAVHRHRHSIAVVREDLRLETVRDLVPVPVPVTDLRGTDPAGTEAALLAIRERTGRREPPHDRWPWMDVALTRYGDNQVRLHLNNNTFFIDAPGSTRLLADALHYLSHPDEPLPELTLAYRDCVLALAEAERSPRGQASRAYWERRIPELPGAPEVPMAPGTAYRGRSRLNRRELRFPAETLAAVKDMAARHGLTVTSALLAAHAETIAAWSGSRHFVLNNMITHRLPWHPEMTQIMGNFAALYPLEVDWRPDEPFRARARRLQAQVMADIEHSYFSGVTVLQRLSAARRTPGRAVAPFAVGSAMFLGAADRPAYSMLETPQTVLDTEFWELRDGDLWVIWDVIEDAFPAGLIDAMADGYRRVVRALAAGPQAWERPVLAGIDDRERTRRAAVNHATGTPATGLLHAPLARWAARRPAALALVTGDRTVTYAELDALTAAAAAASGIEAGDPAAVLAPKGWAQVAAAIAVLRAGGAYVPIDPGWPRERIAYLLADTRATAVLTTGALAAEFAPVAGVRVLAMDDELPATAGIPAVERDPTDPAYVIYTSGSTGRPKGAVLDHRGPVNTIDDVNRRFGVGPDDVLFGVSSLSFDLSVYDIFGALAAGARLVLPPGPDPAGWVEPVARHGVTVWNSVPALMQLFAEAATAAGMTFPALRVVLLSGDWIPVTLPDRIRAIAPNARVISLGGATEASIWSIYHEIDVVDPSWSSIPYGRPLAHQSWYVRDTRGVDAPTWVPGRLYIGGVGVAQGYLNDPERTAAAFATDPATGQRLYHTGDLGRYLPDGSIEFLGRADFQVKINGYRVEPGEVEQVLLEDPRVSGAAVVARSTGSGRQLAAYVVATAGAAELRAYLAGRLPAYLVPAHLTVVDALPLSANGKVDRGALERLRTPEKTGPGGRRDPATPVERELCAIWAQVLDSGPVGVDDDFFALGGQSFAALRVIGLIGQRLGLRVPLGAVLEHPTVAGLADWLTTGGAAYTPLVTLRADGAGEPWFFVHPAGGNVVCYRALADALGTPFVGLQAPGPAVGQAPPETVADLADRYVAALRESVPRDSYQLGGWSSGAAVAAAVAARLEAAGIAVPRLLVVDSPAPLWPRDLDDRDVLRWYLTDLRDGRPVDDELTGALAEVAAGPADQWPAALARLVGGLEEADIAATLPVFRGVVRAVNAHRAEPITAPVTVVRARDGRVEEFADAAAAGPDWGWSSVTRGPVDTVVVAGTHHTLLAGSAVIEVARAAADRGGSR